MQEKFYKTKKEIDVDLATLSADILEIMDTLSHSETYLEKMENLLILAHYCARMPACDFQKHCEDIVNDLVEKFLELPVGSLKQLYARMLFILSRCTQLLQIHKDMGAEDGSSIEKCQQYLKGFPSVEKEWFERKKNLSRDASELHQISEKEICGDEPHFHISRNLSEKRENYRKEDLLDEVMNLNHSKPSSGSCIKSKIMSVYKDEINKHTCNAML
mgnify:CR=1 FL=1